MSANKRLRHLKDVSYDELRAAVTKMCEELGIPGSHASSLKPEYSLYSAVYAEKKRVSPNDPMSKLMNQ